MSQDHPHACGDKYHICINKSDNSGSSPRVWGQETRTSAVDGEIRIIPTRVGTSFTPGAYTQYRQDHPHACGDKGRH